MLTLPADPLVVLACLLLVPAAVTDIRRHGFRTGRGGVVALRSLPDEGEWLVSFADGKVLRLNSLSKYVVHPLAVILEFARSDAAPFKVIIPRDALDAPGFRQLRVMLSA